MDEKYQIAQVESPGRDEWGAIGGGISTYNEQHAGDDSSEHVCFVVRSPDESIVGGILGVTHYGWLCIDLLWVREDLRGRGYGHRLLELAENEGRNRGVGGAYLDTLSFQAPDFYRDHGYEVFGELNDFPVGHQRYYMRKRL